MPVCEFNALATKIKLRILMNARSESISEVVDGIMNVVSASQCACGQEPDVELALRESLANAVLHGARNDANKKIECCVACDDVHGMLVVVRDPGEGFDPASVPDPLVGENLFSNHGRGIFLINQLMDHVEFKRGGTEIHMRKAPPASVPAKNCGL
jgi:serine/threonine-protein kinase RsbW